MNSPVDDNSGANNDCKTNVDHSGDGDGDGDNEDGADDDVREDNPADEESEPIQVRSRRYHAQSENDELGTEWSLQGQRRSRRLIPVAERLGSVFQDGVRRSARRLVP
mmetsp:Transcript_40693/g.45366  ORF Transcript_40693/g.45366 Transcript_40693/m.45366 type:complete len:108 (+) Transcript_40693:243-566(+)